MNTKLSLMIATALLATACGKEKAPRPAQQTAATESTVATSPAPTQQPAQMVQAPVQQTPIQAAPVAAETHQVVEPVAVVPQQAQPIVITPPQTPAPVAVVPQQKTQPAVATPSQQTSAPIAPAPQTTVRTVENHADKQSCRAVTDTEIAALFDRWNASLRTGRPEMVVANYASDSILLPTVSNKVRHTAAEKLDYFQHFLENEPSGEINERFIKIGCNTALDAGVYTFKFAKTGNQVVGRYSYTYEWNGNKWLITSHHSSAMPEKVGAETHKTHVH